ncbi:MAG: hypothetical protein FJ117_02975 [Deltaproteobacteria bacterium]|nr:hypothetical protein [Deltaproteobacteria bacterium]
MTGISEELTLAKILFWPGGQAGMRRKHRLGYPCSWCTHLTSAGGGGRRQPRPIHGEISASWFQADWTGPPAMGSLGLYAEPFLIRPWPPTRD